MYGRRDGWGGRCYEEISMGRIEGMGSLGVVRLSRMGEWDVAIRRG